MRKYVKTWTDLTNSRISRLKEGSIEITRRFLEFGELSMYGNL